jgi:hypothetical protein
MELKSLDDTLVAAHAAQDKSMLVSLYRQAGDQMLDLGKVDAACFYLTHAYIFALDTGDPSADTIHQILVDYGREE